MKQYFENKDFIIPFTKVMIVKNDLESTIFVYFSTQYTLGGRVFEKIMLSGNEATKFTEQYKKWLDAGGENF